VSMSRPWSAATSRFTRNCCPAPRALAGADGPGWTTWSGLPWLCTGPARTCWENAMRISHISVSTLPVLYRFGGAIERRIVEIAREQARRGHRVSVYSVGDADETREVAGVSYHFLKCRTRLPWRHLEFQLKAVPQLNQSPAHVLPLHSQPEGAMLSRATAGRKVLSYDFFAFRGGRRTPLYYVYKSVLKKFDLLLPCSDYCLRESQAFWRLPMDKLKVLYNGVNTRQ